MYYFLRQEELATLQEDRDLPCYKFQLLVIIWSLVSRRLMYHFKILIPLSWNLEC
jgi:hypothetical protein